MTKKRKIIVIVSIILTLILISVLIGDFQYEQHKEKYWTVELIYKYIPTKDEPCNTVWNKTLKQLLENPPPIKMNDYDGLYICTQSYTYFTGRTVDYLDIEQMMNSGKILEVVDKYQDYLGWIQNNPNKLFIITGSIYTQY